MQRETFFSSGIATGTGNSLFYLVVELGYLSLLYLLRLVR